MSITIPVRKIFATYSDKPLPGYSLQSVLSQMYEEEVSARKESSAAPRKRSDPERVKQVQVELLKRMTLRQVENRLDESLLKEPLMFISEVRDLCSDLSDSDQEDVMLWLESLDPINTHEFDFKKILDKLNDEVQYGRSKGTGFQCDNPDGSGAEGTDKRRQLSASVPDLLKVGRR